MNSPALFFVPILGQIDAAGIVAIIVGLIILWILVSIPVYIAGKVVTRGASTLTDAMIATLFGPIVYTITVFLVDYFLGLITGSGAGSQILALVVAFFAWLWVFKASFKTGWLRALAIALLAILIFTAISALFGFLLNVMVPAPFFPRF